tara:strand:- start:442 stop:1452 length:1011 start_codon:yes stop_codon:yes gene_type:complete
MTKIILEIGEELKDIIYTNQELEIICKGNNIIEGCLFSNIICDVLIIIKGKNVIIRNNRFQEISKTNKLIELQSTKGKIINNLFIFCNIKIMIDTFLNSSKNLISRNRIENVECKKIILLNSLDNLVCHNEIINCKGIIKINENNNNIIHNKIDYKNNKNTIFLSINSSNNKIKSNLINNCEIGIYFITNKGSLIINNVFSSCKNVYKLNKKKGYVNLIMKNNNYVSCTNKFSNKELVQLIIKQYEEKKDVEFKHIFDQNINESEDLNELLKISNINNIEYKIEKVKDKSDINKPENCCCNELKKMIKAQMILAEYKDCNKRMNKCIIQLEQLLKS